jgi:hypothetical protein
MLKRKWYLMAEEGGDSGDGGGGGDAAPAASDDAAPAAAPATPAFTPAATPAATALKAEDQAPKGVWPDAWREQWAKDDAKKMSRISKYSSPEAAFDALIAAQNKISAGQVKDPFPKDGTDADKAAWRKANDVPDSFEKYEVVLPDGMVISDMDRELMDDYLKSAFEANVPKSVAQHNVAWHFQQQEALLAKQAEKDNDQSTAARDALRDEWGGAFKENMNMVAVVLERFPESVRDSILNGRLQNGQAIFNNVEVLRAFADLAREITGGVSVVPAGSGDPMKTVADEISSIEKQMRENRPAYNKDEKMQSRYRELIEAQQKMQGRKAA